MKRIEKLAIFIRSWEGGYSNIPQDSGGPTNKGVTLATFQHVFGKDKTVSDLKNITLEQWEHIFKRYFWDRWKADNIKDEWVSYLLVDWIWGSGKYGITKVQQYLRIPADGIVGPQTINKLNSIDGRQAFTAIWNIRKQYLYSISKGKNKIFLKGWLRRLNGIQYGKLITNDGKVLK